MRHGVTTRRGSVYVIVLFTTLAVVAMVMGGMELQQASRRGTQAATDTTRARLLAQSALELGLQMVNDDPARTSVNAQGAWLTNVSVAGGIISVVASDPVDGVLTNNTDHAIVLTATASVGSATQYAQAKANAVYTPIPAITGSLVSNGKITLTSAAFSATNTAMTASSAAASNSTILAPFQTVSGTSGSTFSVTPTVAAAPSIPTFAQASSFYVGTRPKGTLGLLSLRTISSMLIAPGSNPFGVANAPDGVYVVDCQKQSVTIKDCRIVGTLVLVNLKGGVTISGSVAWEPFVAGYPALIADDDLILSMSATPLSEATLGVNLNGLLMGLTGGNSTMTDTYPSKIRGIVYGAGKVTASGASAVQGVVLTPSTVDVTGSLIIQRDANLSSSPPPGFRTGPTMVVEAGSWKQLVQ